MTDDAGLLLRRAGFGPTPSELAAARQSGFARTAADLFEPPGPDVGATRAPIPTLPPDPFASTATPTEAQAQAAVEVRGRQRQLITRWLLDRMVVADHQAVERLQFFWHGHWATRVASPQLTLAQNRTLRGARDFVDMAHKMVADRALVYWLDGQHNRKDAPNENLARELFELFVLGIGHYTEKDVKAAARALTGYRVALDREELIFDAVNHDTGLKTILGTTANYTPETLVDLLMKQRATPRFIATRMWFRYASSSDPIPGSVRERMAAAFPHPLPMLRAMFEDEAFRRTAGTMVKPPVEWLVGALRQLGLRPATFTDIHFDRLYWQLEALGQRPFSPPSVGGWPSGTAWLTSAAANVKLAVAKELADLFHPPKLTPETVAYLLCVDKWTDRTYAVLRDVQDPRLLLTLGLVSPEYQVT
jgi:uncharacterized protein (DUF1800 family)